MALPSPLPDDPRKWEGWSKYKSPDYYERLGLDISESPSGQLIEESCRQLMVWWQKKLPLKNQPSNPIAQLLRNGLDEAPHYLSEARMLLLDTEQRTRIDAELNLARKTESAGEILKFLDFAIGGGYLTQEAEENLIRMGRDQGIPREEIVALIDQRLMEKEANRVVGTETRTIPFPATDSPSPAPLPDDAADATTPGIPFSDATTQVANDDFAGDPSAQFFRILKLSGLQEEDFNQEKRETFIAMGRGLGIDEMDADALLDQFLENLDADGKAHAPSPTPVATRKITQPVPMGTKKIPHTQTVKVPQIELTTAEERSRFTNFKNTCGMEMIFIPSTTFVMGSVSPEAMPNERPTTRVKLTRYFAARLPVTNAQYELFDSSHKSKRSPWADGTHPVVYVNSQNAMQFCQWLSSKEKRKYRLPTEAEWEYFAKGPEPREYPWGNDPMDGTLCNFADKNTKFAWSDAHLDSGFAETSPVGSFPRGASPFGGEDLAGNVWEWCIDFFDNYKGGELTNPRGLSNGSKRVYRGGSWRTRLTSCRTTARSSNSVDYSFNDVGFRVICECAAL